jgi:4-hydroxybenzoate polyprenyltransferase
MRISPYLRLIRFDKPIGTALLFWPVAWALWIVSKGQPPIDLLLIFTLGVFLMRSAGCIINDIIDRKLDIHVTRTKTRPLASGEISLTAAVLFFIILLGLAASLLFFLNPLCFYLAVLAALLSCLYPLAKRFTYFPQLVLGITFNMGVLMVYAAFENAIPVQAYLLYTASIFWTLAYDTFYAMSDQADDIKLGIKSTALKFGENTLYWILAFYAVFILLFLLATQNWFALVALPAIGFILWQAKHTSNYLRAFKYNGYLGGLLFLVLVL